jgi:hypothetical protein
MASYGDEEKDELRDSILYLFGKLNIKKKTIVNPVHIVSKIIELIRSEKGIYDLNRTRYSETYNREEIIPAQKLTRSEIDQRIENDQLFYYKEKIIFFIKETFDPRYDSKLYAVIDSTNPIDMDNILKRVEEEMYSDLYVPIIKGSRGGKKTRRRRKNKKSKKSRRRRSRR